ncbi:MAG: glutamate racemase, partial [Clostridia bacterium]|nr:glutamate racemase [Clostridia bacterium]
MSDKSSLPIGVFDSGLGGLTAMSELARLMPNEDIVYFGDNARIPYGTKSPEIIKKFALQDTR